MAAPVRSVLPVVPSAQLAALLAKNNEQHHIYFRGGLHNHFTHTAVSLAGLGAPTERLVKEFEAEQKYLDPARPLALRNGTTQLADDDWTSPEVLGNEAYYPNLCRFFLGIFRPANGPYADTSRMGELLMHPAVFPRLFSGLLHPIIHAGYACETRSPEVFAEAFALACINRPSFVRRRAPSGSGGGVRMEDAVRRLWGDARFDALLVKEASAGARIAAVTKGEGGKVLEEYMAMVDFGASEAEVSRALDSLSYSASLLAVATGFLPRKPGTPSLDFLLLHVLTSVFALHQLRPALIVAELGVLVRAMQEAAFVYYLERGRPEVREQDLPELPELDWPAILAATVSETSTDLHVPKAIRALYHFAHSGIGDGEVLRKGAAVIVRELVWETGRGAKDIAAERAGGRTGGGFQRGWRYDARGFVEREAKM
ncbi:hypothetical protein DFJ74DRAFT_712333 [Hyaloraphidium curvatum]|nr:hypothetical protein DFJ74DRAFT_712333 [Hyaloraphidium curvatum]